MLQVDHLASQTGKTGYLKLLSSVLSLRDAMCPHGRLGVVPQTCVWFFIKVLFISPPHLCKLKSTYHLKVADLIMDLKCQPYFFLYCWCLTSWLSLPILFWISSICILFLLSRIWDLVNWRDVDPWFTKCLSWRNTCILEGHRVGDDNWQKPRKNITGIFAV